MGLVENWRQWWRRWSTWASGINAALWASITAKSGLLLGFVGFVAYIPTEWQAFAAGALAALTFLLTFVLPVVIVNIRQPKLAPCDDTRQPGA